MSGGRRTASLGVVAGVAPSAAARCSTWSSSGPGEGVVVWEASRCRQLRTSLVQSGKELGRTGDPRKRQDPLATQVLVRCEARLQDGKAWRQHGARAGQVRADQHGSPAPGRRRGHRLPQGTGGHDAAVAEAERPVHHQQRRILNQAGILQAVVHHQRLRPLPHRGTGAGGTVGADPGGGGRGQQQRLVTHQRGAVPGRVHPQRAADPAAVAAGQAMHLHAPRLQPAHQVQGQRRLARAAHAGVAAAQHGHRRPPSRPGDPPRRAARHQRRQRGQQTGQRAVLRPESGRRHHACQRRQGAGRRAGTAARVARSRPAPDALTASSRPVHQRQQRLGRAGRQVRIPRSCRLRGLASRRAPGRVAQHGIHPVGRKPCRVAAPESARLPAASAPLPRPRGLQCTVRPPRRSRAAPAPSGFCPPCPTRLRPTNASGARRYSKPSSPRVSAIQMPCSGRRVLRPVTGAVRATRRRWRGRGSGWRGRDDGQQARMRLRPGCRCTCPGQSRPPPDACWRPATPGVLPSSRCSRANSAASAGRGGADSLQVARRRHVPRAQRRAAGRHPPADSCLHAGRNRCQDVPCESRRAAPALRAAGGHAGVDQHGRDAPGMGRAASRLGHQLRLHERRRVRPPVVQKARRPGRHVQRHEAVQHLGQAQRRQALGQQRRGGHGPCGEHHGYVRRQRLQDWQDGQAFPDACGVQPTGLCRRGVAPGPFPRAPAGVEPTPCLVRPGAAA